MYGRNLQTSTLRPGCIRLWRDRDAFPCFIRISIIATVTLIFWGLDDHVDHHLYPVVPSRNLPKLHRILEKDLPDPENVFGCWTEMFEISREKDRDPEREFVSVEAQEAAPGAAEKRSAEAL